MVQRSLHKALLFLLAPIAGVCGLITPGTPQAIPHSTSVASTTGVAATSSRAVAVWADSTGAVWQISSLDGISWNAGSSSIIATGITTFLEICKGPLGYGVIAYIYTTQIQPYFIFSSDGISWDMGQIVPVPPNIGNGGAAPSIAGNNQGFMTTYTLNPSGVILYGYSSFYDGSSWSTATKIDSATIAGESPSVAVYQNTFVATWVDNTNFNAQSGISTDMGATWSAPSAITNDNSVNSQVTVSATSKGFLAAWVDVSGNAQSSFSNDAMTWSSPVQIASDINTSDNTAIGLSGTSDGYIAAWQDSMNNAYASFSEDGSSWADPVQIGTGLDSIDSSIIGVSFFGSKCLFTWTSGSAPYSNLCQVELPSSSSPHSYKRPSNRR